MLTDQISPADIERIRQEAGVARATMWRLLQGQRVQPHVPQRLRLAAAKLRIELPADLWIAESREGA